MEMRLNRAGRKRQIERIMKGWDSKRKGATMNTGMIAKKLGIRSSTHLVNILKEMEKEKTIRSLSTAPNPRYGYSFRVWQYVRWEQSKLPDHEIIINGISCRMSEVLA
jgi:DNA-binding Lrp family transcriptional regulator